MRKATACAAIVAVLGAALAGPAEAQQRTVCGERAGVAARLEAIFGETLRAVGVVNERAVLEVWASAETGTWTILVTRTNGEACVVALGDAFEARPARAAEAPL